MKKILIKEKHRPLMEVWIEDLRMNPDKQGEGALYSASHDLYCCLGRLCKVAGVSEEVMDNEPDLYSIDIDSDIFQSIPKPFLINSSDLPGTVINTLITMNDTVNNEVYVKEWDLVSGKQYTFPEIADFLEQRIEYV